MSQIQIACVKFFKHELVQRLGPENCYPLRLFFDFAKLDNNESVLNTYVSELCAQKKTYTNHQLAEERDVPLRMQGCTHAATTLGRHCLDVPCCWLGAALSQKIFK